MFLVRDLFEFEIFLCIESSRKYAQLCNPLNLFAEFDKHGFHHFPLLQLDDGNFLFSSDAIMKYLLPNEEPVELRDQVSISIISS